MNNPKRRKDKENPYTIKFNEVENIYLVSFKDGTNNYHEVEISKEVYDVFDEFELKDISLMHKINKHIDYCNYDDSEEIENKIYSKCKNAYYSLEDDFIEQMENYDLKQAISELPDIQKRRIIKYYFYDMTYEEIAKEEECTKRAVKFSVDIGIENILKKLQK